MSEKAKRIQTSATIILTLNIIQGLGTTIALTVAAPKLKLLVFLISAVISFVITYAVYSIMSGISENIILSENNSQKLDAILNKLNKEDKKTDTTSNNQIPDTKKCPKCGTVQPANRTKCFECGAEF